MNAAAKAANVASLMPRSKINAIMPRVISSDYGLLRTTKYAVRKRCYGPLPASSDGTSVLTGNAAVVLAADEPWVDDGAGREGADEARRPDLPQLRVHFTSANTAPCACGLGLLRERISVGAAASLNLDQAGPVAPQDGPGPALEHDGRKGRGAEPPPDQQPVLVTHPSRR